MPPADIHLTYGKDALTMGRALLEASGAAALFKGRQVALKPNLVVARPASQGATTHPGFAQAVLEAARDAGAKELIIMESTGVGGSTAQAFAQCGYEALAKRFGAKLLDLRRDPSVSVECAGERYSVCQSAAEAEVLVNLPVLKAHCQTRLTCAIKNLKGCIPDEEKRRFHKLGLTRPISRLPLLFKSALTLVDGICGDLTFEEGGTPMPMHRAFLCADPVATDAYAASLLGLSLEDVPYIRLARELRAGDTAYTLHTVGEEPKDKADFSDLSGFAGVRRLTQDVREKAACSACYGSLVRALHLMEEEGGTAPRDVSIGQGFAGERGEGLGIGRCCSGFARCVPGCPPAAADILDFLRKIP